MKPQRGNSHRPNTFSVVFFKDLNFSHVTDGKGSIQQHMGGFLKQPLTNLSVIGADPLTSSLFLNGGRKEDVYIAMIPLLMTLVVW